MRYNRTGEVAHKAVLMQTIFRGARVRPSTIKLDEIYTEMRLYSKPSTHSTSVSDRLNLNTCIYTTCTHEKVERWAKETVFSPVLFSKMESLVQFRAKWHVTS